MASHRALAILTALLLVSGARTVSAQSYTVDQLLEVERLIVAGDYQTLNRYLAQHPGLFQGNDPLAIELRKLVVNINADPLSRFGYRGGATVAMQDIY